MDMLELERTYPDAYADEIEERFRELVLAYRVVAVEHAGDGSAPDASPVLRQSGRTFTGRDEIDPYLADLTNEVLLGREFQSDACYLDPDDPSRCL